MNIQFKPLNDTATIPRRQTPGSAGFDLHLNTKSTHYVYAGDVRRFPTGIAVAIPEGYVGLIRDRSGLASKGLTVLGGVIDSDYRGEIQVLMTSVSEGSVKLLPGERIAQLVVVPCLLDATATDVLDKTERGDAGFGSSGRT